MISRPDEMINFTIVYSANRPDAFSKSSNPNKPWKRNKFGKLFPRDPGS